MDQLNNLSKQKKPSNERQPSIQERVAAYDPERALKMLEELRAMSEDDGDTSEWEQIKKWLEEDRLGSRKLFPYD